MANYMSKPKKLHLGRDEAAFKKTLKADTMRVANCEPKLKKVN